MLALDEEANKLTDIKVTDAELEAIFDAMFPVDYVNDTPRKINNINEMKMNIFKCYGAPDIAQYKGTAWGVMNAVSDYVCHGTPARLTQNYRENNWGKIMAGHPLLDQFYTAMKKVAA